MNTEILEKEKFETLKELADMTVQISEARETLTRLKETKTEYLQIRENEAKDKIQKILDDSVDLLRQINTNNDEIHQLYRTVSGYSKFLKQGHEAFKDMLAEFNERSDLWDKKVEEQYKEFGRIENQVKKDKENIENDKEELRKTKEQLEKDKIKIADERQTIKRAVERLKENRK